MRVEVENFLKKYNMHYDDIDLNKCCKEFIDEMNKGLEGKDSSLMMLPTYISIEGDVPTNKPIIVMDAGGTNFRVAVVYFNENKAPIIGDFNIYPMPGTKGAISKEEFFNTIADYLMPVINKSDRIGFCFSFPTDIMPNKDGKLIHFNKEVTIGNMTGVYICDSISQVLKARGCKDVKKFVLINDTVATLLGGIASNNNRVFDSYIGFILGTGTNTCYIEENNNITKINLSSEKSSSMAINMESGGYSKMPMGEFDKAFDSTTINPGKQTYEKKISGVYQGSVITFTINQAIKDGLFSEEFAERFAGIEVVSMRNIDDFCFYPYGDNVLADCCDKNENDMFNLYYIIDASFERAAKMVTVNLSSIILKTGKGKNPNKPVCIVAEGTTFYKSKLFKYKLDYYIKDFLENDKGIHCEFMKAENTTLTGTAIAGLLN